MGVKLGDFLLKEKLITKEQLDIALEYQKKNGIKLGSALLKLGFVTEDEIINVLSKQYGYPAINISKFDVEPEIIKLIPADVARKYIILPIHRIGTILTVAMSDPTNLTAIEDVKFITNLNVQPVIAPESALKVAIDKHYGSLYEVEVKKVIEKAKKFDTAKIQVVEEIPKDEFVDLEKISEEGPIVQLVNLIISEAINRGASDIHMEPYEKEFRIRYRIDGILYPVMTPPYRMKDSFISRIKILAKMDIAEKRLPQDGRINIRIKTQNKNIKEVDMRVSSLPTMFGEKIAIRILDREQLKLDLGSLGFELSSLEKFEKQIKKPWGIILVTGPTGSGKTNTLYSTISTLNSPEINILTAENPIEFNLFGINQVQIKEEIGLTFATCLKSFLRQDPNIILVGEIRDFETADIAIKAALTGHLVLSTVHTNDAPTTISRLINMGIEPYLIATSVNLIVAQRLVRRICKKCRTETQVPPQALIDLGFYPDEIEKITIFKARGCPECNDTGYKGRIGLFEVMELTEELREMIISGASTSEIRNKAISQGMISLRRSGLEKIKSGITSIEEVLRETINV
ncbi:MAG: type IV-A pilus assembly ATPase PilB [Acidobacteriota bacterium]